MKNRKILEIRNQSEVYLLKPENIVCVKADGNYCDIYLADGDILEGVCFQRAEICRMIDQNLEPRVAKQFALVGRSILINEAHVQYLNVPRQKLVFDVAYGDTSKKLAFKVSVDALRKLYEQINRDEEDSHIEVSDSSVPQGFARFLASSGRYSVDEEVFDYDCGDDDVVYLG